MKLLCLGFALLISACGGKYIPPALGPITLDVDPSIAIQAPNGNAGHACAVFNDYGEFFLTASHVVWNEETQSYMPVVWSDGFGQEGYFETDGPFSAVDVALLNPVGEKRPFALPQGPAGKPGDTVYWFEYDFRTRKNALRARRRFAKILRVVAQHYILDDLAEGGSSGTCLLDAQGEVIGIVVSGWDTADNLGVTAAVKLP